MDEPAGQPLDLRRLRYCLAWDAGRRSPLIDDFVDAVERSSGDAASAPAL